ncbi:AgmX/PglI C-terminal domain-containing protein [Anaeromyxobacter paludicola]|uniref:TonB family protein n=1 Tax=Anaeromyxobacter paludicola TaxID=2918171 RepID=A0ABM7XF01_9BACT|nr:AgmX/PglI C-terminal domain-containing protein [Anaeromyxobacter paludicola]BDG10433.1 hypothetical protein AMPC_35460 [Anaeromyxobacter paludicola]
MAKSNQAHSPSPVPASGLPAVPHGHRFRSLDRAFLVILLCSLASHVGAYAALARTPPREEVTLEQIPDRFARILIPEKAPEQPPEAKVEEKRPEVAEKKAEEKPKEEAPAPEDPPEVVAEKKARHAAEVTKAVQSKGILKVLGALGGAGGGLGGAAVKDVFGEGGATDVAAALAGAGGVAVASGEGAAGAGGRRGAAASTGAARIGDLGTTGGGGKVDYGARAEAKVSGSVGMEEAEVDSPDVDQARLGAFIRARMSAVKACYESQLKRNPGLRGKIRIRFTILETGALSDVQAVENGIGSSEVASCIVATMRTWRTQFHPSGVVTVEHGFVFSAN